MIKISERPVIFIILMIFIINVDLPAQSRKKIETKTVDQLIDDLLGRMTTEEKIGQLSLFSAGKGESGPMVNNDNAKLVKEGKAGAVLNAVGVDYVHELQRIAVEETRLKIPLLFGLDVIHGYRTIFPIPLAQSCSWDTGLIRQSERIAATEASADGISWTFAPMVDIARDPRWGRVAEGAGEDTWLGSRIAEARVKGFQGDDLKAPGTLLACAKHFAAYGAPQAGREYNTVDMSRESLYEWYLPPYRSCVAAGVGSVMTSFNEIAGVPSTANRGLLTDVLRNEWGFAGFVVTDYTAINELINHGVAGDLSEAAKLAIYAGVDMDMQGNAYLGELGRLISGNRVKMLMVDRSVKLILAAKYKLGLFDDPYRNCSAEQVAKVMMTPENRAFARRMVTASCVLLKNDNQTLPLPSTVKTIAIIGPLGDSRKDMTGCWEAEGKEEECISLAEGIRSRAGKDVNVVVTKGCNANDQDKSGFDEAVRTAGSADFVILALGEEKWMCGEAASRSMIGLPGVQEELAEKVLKTGKPAAVVLFNGRPLAIPGLTSAAPAILETWFGGTEAGNGIADILFGDVNPSGKLTMTFPRNEGQIPIFYNSKNTGRPFDSKSPDEKYVSRYIDVPNDPLFPFGFGLSYTTFAYSGLSVTAAGDSVKAKVKVTNTGSRDGEEVVQLYIQDKVASITRPVKELKGFKKVMIKKGETRELEFAITADDLAFYHPDLNKFREPGEFVLYIGTNSAETIQASFWIK